MPTFLIVGAAKSGTTSLYHYLGQHPEIFLSPVKEPKYFATASRHAAYGGPGDTEDMRRHLVTDLDAYHALFRSAQTETAVGEASTLYLYDPEAAEQIHATVPGVKLVAVLRNPVERAYSNFLYMVRRGNEPLRDFAEAVAAEDHRVAHHWMPTWHYCRRGLYAEQIRRYLDRFAPEQLKVCLYDDFRRTPARVLGDVFRFLGVDDRFTPDLWQRHNVSGVPRSERLHAGLARASWVKDVAHTVVPSRVTRSLARRVRRWNLTRPELDPDVRRRLVTFFRHDVRTLETLIQRDLSGWLN